MFHNKNDHFINGITLNVKDIEEMKHFYSNILGLNIVTESDSNILYQIGVQNHFISLNQIERGREPLSAEAGLFHLAIQLSSQSALADILVQLSDYSLPVDGGENHLTTSLYVNDPEGNGLEFYVEAHNEDWDNVEEQVTLDTLPINVPKLLKHVSNNQWQGIPNESQIGYLNLKTIAWHKVKPYYKNFFNLEVASLDTDEALYMSSKGDYQHLVVNNWHSYIKRIENDVTYGLACVDCYYPDTAHKRLTGPDGIQFRFNYYEVE